MFALPYYILYCLPTFRPHTTTHSLHPPYIRIPFSTRWFVVESSDDSTLSSCESFTLRDDSAFSNVQSKRVPVSCGPIVYSGFEGFVDFLWCLFSLGNLEFTLPFPPHWMLSLISAFLIMILIFLRLMFVTRGWLLLSRLWLEIDWCIHLILDLICQKQKLEIYLVNYEMRNGKKLHKIWMELVL